MDQAEGNVLQELAVESLQKLHEEMKSQIRKYDKYFLMLSIFLALGSGVLRGNLLEEASGLGCLAFSTMAFLFTIISLILAHIHINIIIGTARQNQMTQQDRDEQVILETNQLYEALHWWNIINGSLFIAGVLGILGFLIAFWVF